MRWVKEKEKKEEREGEGEGDGSEKKGFILQFWPLQDPIPSFLRGLIYIFLLFFSIFYDIFGF